MCKSKELCTKYKLDLQKLGVYCKFRCVKHLYLRVCTFSTDDVVSDVTIKENGSSKVVPSRILTLPAKKI